MGKWPAFFIGFGEVVYMAGIMIYYNMLFLLNMLMPVDLTQVSAKCFIIHMMPQSCFQFTFFNRSGVDLMFPLNEAFSFVSTVI